MSGLEYILHENLQPSNLFKYQRSDSFPCRGTPMNLNLKTGRGYGASASGISVIFTLYLLQYFTYLALTAGAAANLGFSLEGYQISASYLN